MTRKKTVSVRRGAGDDLVLQYGVGPDYTSGDVAFLDHDSPHHCQLRPLLDHELPAGSMGYPPGTQVLVCRPPVGIEVRALVKLPPLNRKNTPANVDRAIQKVSRFNRSAGVMFKRAKAGLDPLGN